MSHHNSFSITIRCPNCVHFSVHILHDCVHIFHIVSTFECPHHPSHCVHILHRSDLPPATPPVRAGPSRSPMPGSSGLSIDCGLFLLFPRDGGCREGIAIWMVPVEAGLSFHTFSIMPPYHYNSIQFEFTVDSLLLTSFSLTMTPAYRAFAARPTSFSLTPANRAFAACSSATPAAIPPPPNVKSIALPSESEPLSSLFSFEIFLLC